MTPLEQIERRMAPLGNHFQKFYRNIERHHEALAVALEESDRVLEVDLWGTSPSPDHDMRVVVGLSDDAVESVRHLSCYYAIQFLRMNFRHLDILSLGIASGHTLKEAYYTFMKQIGFDFRALTRAYMESLLTLHIPREEWPEFFVCSVGTRADQDDIDVGIVTVGGPGDRRLNEAFQHITQHMLVYATPLHLHLSEHVGQQIYTSTIDEYARLLDREIGDVVILSELINASRILGSKELFDRFGREIMARYFYDPDADPRFHEGFLRGIMGEARALLVSPLQPDAICPKDDAIRSLKFLLYAKKAVHGLEEVNAWDLIQALIRREPHLDTEYEFLFEATSFLEMFRFQMQMFVVQEETFRLGDIDPDQLQLVAERMGYRPIGTVTAWEQLITDYYRHVKEVRSLCEYLLGDLRRHLSSVSVFSPESDAQVPLRDRSATGEPFASRFIRTTRFFRATRYWDDVLERFESDRHLLDMFIDSFEDIDPMIREDMIEEYVGWAEHSPLTITRFLTALARRQENEIGRTLAHDMNEAFLGVFERMPYNSERVCRIFSHYPKVIHEYLQYLSEDGFDAFHTIISRRVIDERLLPVQTQLIELLRIHQFSGQYFHRYFARGDDYSFQGHELMAGLDAPLPFDVRLEARTSYMYKPFRRPSSYPDPGTLQPGVQYTLDGQSRRDQIWRFDDAPTPSSLEMTPQLSDPDTRIQKRVRGTPPLRSNLQFSQGFTRW